MSRYISWGVAVLLIIAALPMPYGFYMLVRLVATVYFAFAAFVFFKSGWKIAPWICIFGALLFQPLAKVPFDKEIWVVLDIIAGIAAIVISVRLEKDNAKLT